MVFLAQEIHQEMFSIGFFRLKIHQEMFPVVFLTKKLICSNSQPVQLSLKNKRTLFKHSYNEHNICDL